MDQEKKVNQKESNEVAEHNFQPTDYKKDKELSSGLAMTHEQVTDMWTEGTIDGEIDDINGKDEELRR
jgi:hypothetical protein